MKLVLLFIICIIVGVSLSSRSHNTTTPASTDAPATPVVPTEQNSTRYEYKIEYTDAVFAVDTDAVQFDLTAR